MKYSQQDFDSLKRFIDMVYEIRVNAKTFQLSAEDVAEIIRLNKKLCPTATVVTSCPICIINFIQMAFAPFYEREYPIYLKSLAATASTEIVEPIKQSRRKKTGK